MESNGQTELTSKIQTDSEVENRLMAMGRGGSGVEELSKKEKGLMDNSVVIVAGKEV